MATGVGRGRIWLASFNSPTSKPPVIHKDLVDISYVSLVIGEAVPIPTGTIPTGIIPTSTIPTLQRSTDVEVRRRLQSDSAVNALLNAR